MLALLLDRGRSGGKQVSKRLKFVHFCRDEGYLPIPVPTPAVMYMRFMLWLPSNGITSGWRGCLAYATALAHWNKQLGFPDTRDEIEYWWSTFRLNFRNSVVSARLNTKLPLRPWMLLAILATLDLDHSWACQ